MKMESIPLDDMKARKPDSDALDIGATQNHGNGINPTNLNLLSHDLPTSPAKALALHRISHPQDDHGHRVHFDEQARKMKANYSAALENDIYASVLRSQETGHHILGSERVSRWLDSVHSNLECELLPSSRDYPAKIWHRDHVYEEETSSTDYSDFAEWLRGRVADQEGWISDGDKAAGGSDQSSATGCEGDPGLIESVHGLNNNFTSEYCRSNFG